MRKTTRGAAKGRDALDVRDKMGEARRLSLRQIEVFRAVMVSGSINGAAAMLHVSQPGLSRMIRRTEDVLGFALFERVKGRLSPTKEAGTLFAAVGGVYRQLDQLSLVVGRMVRGEDGLFRVGTTGSPGRRVVPRAVARLHGISPQLAFQIDVLLIEQIIDYLILQTGECVISIFPVQHPLIHSEAIGQGGLVCLIPNGHRLVDRGTVTVSDLEAEFLILFEPETPHGDAAERLFTAQGRRPNVGVRVRHVDTAIALVASGVGPAIIDSFAVAGEVSPPFTVAAIAGSPKLHVHLNRNRETVRSQFFGRLRDVLTAELG